MTQAGGNGEGEPGDVVGLPVEDAVDQTLQRAAIEADRGEVRATLERVTEDGVVTEAAVEDAVAHVSKVVSTPETRVELAEHALADARDRAALVADLDAVAFRLDGYANRLDALDAELAELREALATVVHDREQLDSTYALAARIRRLTTDANAVQGRADELQLDLEEFEAWLDDHDRRVDELDGDVDALRGALAELDDAVDAIEAEIEADDDTADDPDVATDADAIVDDPAAAWLDAALHQRVYALLLDDLAAERADLGRLAAREEIDDVGGGLGALDRQLDELVDAHEATGRRIEALAPTDRSGVVAERLDAFAADLDEYEPPVQWAAVLATLEERRADAGDAT